MSFSDPAEWTKFTSGPERERETRGEEEVPVFHLFTVHFTTPRIKNAKILNGNNTWTQVRT